MKLNMSRHIFHMTESPSLTFLYRQVAPAKASFKEVGVGEVDWMKGTNIHKPRFVASGNPLLPHLSNQTKLELHDSPR